MTDRSICADCGTKTEAGSCPNPECPGRRRHLIEGLLDERKRIADRLRTIAIADRLRTIATNGGDACGHYDPLYDLADELDPEGEA